MWRKRVAFEGALRETRTREVMDEDEQGRGSGRRGKGMKEGM